MAAKAAYPVPDAALDADICTIAQKGAGKTYANRGLVERLLDAGRRVVVLDPLNSWWGLKARADGRPGYPIVVIGGPNADLPLDVRAGERLGEILAGAEISVVVDVSDLKRGELQRFAADFLGALYRVNRDPLWLVLEEADVFAPQNPMGDAIMLLHQVDQIARRGRARGFRLWSISQRPAKLHKDVLTQTSTLMVLRLRSPQDRAAAEAWIKGNAEAPQAQEVMASMASLPTGEGWVWSPDHQLLQRVKFPPIKTLDTSATPQAGEPRRVAGELAHVDVAGLAEALAMPPEVEERGAGGQGIERIRREAYMEGFHNGEVAGVAKTHGVWLGQIKACAEAATSTLATASSDAASSASRLAAKATSAAPPVKGAPAPQAAPAASPPPTKGAAKLAEILEGGQQATLSTSAQRLLRAIQSAPRRVSWSEAALLAVVAPHGGSFNRACKELRDFGSVVQESDGLAPKEAPKDPQPPPADEIVAAWASKLGGSAARILRHLFVAQDDTREAIADVLQVAPHGGSWNRAWKSLRDAGLVIQDGQRWRLADIFEDLPRERRR